MRITKLGKGLRLDNNAVYVVFGDNEYTIHDERVNETLRKYLYIGYENDPDTIGVRFDDDNIHIGDMVKINEEYCDPGETWRTYLVVDEPFSFHGIRMAHLSGVVTRYSTDMLTKISN